MRFSASTKNFYPKSIKYPALPDDIQDVPYEDFVAAMNRGPAEDLDLVNGRVVVVPRPALPLADQKEVKRTEIREACHGAITSGIDNAVLGTVHHYPTLEEDQININGLITYSQIIGEAGGPYDFWCADIDGVWARRGHTVAQIQAVGLAMAEHKMAVQALYSLKLAAIDTAITAEELDLISWD